MTKKQYKNRIMRLESRIGEMQEQVVHCRRQAKLLDAEDSKKLLEKYHIESEELAELIYKHQQENKKKATENVKQTETVAKALPELKSEAESVPRRSAKTVVSTVSQEESVSKQVEPASDTVHQPGKPINPLDMFK